MVMISVDLQAMSLNKARLRAVMPLVNEIYADSVLPDTGKFSRVNRDFTPHAAKVQALKIIREIPEAVVVLSKGRPDSLTELKHEVAPKQLGTALRMMKVADDYGIRLIPDGKMVGKVVMINGKPATADQIEALDIDWRVAFGYKNTKVTMLLEVAEAEVLGHVVQLKDEAKTRDVGFNRGVFDEIRTVLAEYGLPAEAVIEGWPV